MLENLKIENVAIIEKASIDFEEGLNVMSGETGAGKSIILDSLGAVLGQRTSKDSVRTGEKKAKVTALFTNVNKNVINKLEELDVDIEEDNCVLIQRQINLEGKNVCKINGCPVTVSMLKELGHELINIHGQNDNQNLLNPEKHIDFIDSLGNYSDLHKQYQDSYFKLQDIKKSLSKLNTSEEEKLKKIDILNYQINELEMADIRIGEREDLIQKKDTYQNSEKIIKNLNISLEILNGNMDTDGANALISNVADSLENISSYIEGLENISSNIRDISYNLEEYSNDIRSYLNDFDYNPNEIDNIEERLDTLYKLSLKYGSTEEEMLEYLKNAQEQLNEIMFSDEKIQKLKLKLKSAQADAAELAERLSQSRRKVADDFEKHVESELAFLDMPSIKFVVNQEKIDLTENGCDRIEFLISANVGESVKPLAKIASGGELSRIMLAIKNVMSEKDEIGTLVFDEIDTGVSGSASQKIAIKLSQVSKGRQVICVTHGVQIASYADNHLLIKKEVKDNKTFTQVKSLSMDERVKEIARIVGGLNVSELQLKNAEEMLRSSNILQGDL